jgi:hypothetical protein
MSAPAAEDPIDDKHARLKRARERRYRFAKAAAEAMDIPYGTYSGHEAGTRGFDEADAQRYAKFFGVPVVWILYGQGPEPDLKPVYKTQVNKQGQRKPLIGSFDPDALDQVELEPRMVEGTMGRDVGRLPQDAILQADVAIGMGPGGMTHVTDLMNPDGNSYAAEGVKDWWRLPADVVRGRFRVPAHRVRCFEAMGDSMEPKIHDGDIVFVDVGHRVPSPPGIYALADALGGVILKRLEISSARGQEPVRVRLISDNPKHTPEDRTLDEITITGRYLGRLTTE